MSGSLISLFPLSLYPSPHKGRGKHLTPHIFRSHPFHHRNCREIVGERVIWSTVRTMRFIPLDGMVRLALTIFDGWNGLTEMRSEGRCKWRIRFGRKERKGIGFKRRVSGFKGFLTYLLLLEDLLPSQTGCPPALADGLKEYTYLWLKPH